MNIFQSTPNIFNVIHKTPKARATLLNFFLLWAKPREKFYFRQLIKLLGLNPNSLKKELDDLTKNEILKEERLGNLHFYFINEHNLFIDDYRKLVNFRLILTEKLKTELSSVKNIEYAFIFGSFTKETWTRSHDIDLMIIGNIDYDELSLRIARIENHFQIEINFILYTKDEFIKKLSEDSNFLYDIIDKDASLTHPLINLKGAIKQFIGTIKPGREVGQS